MVAIVGGKQSDDLCCTECDNHEGCQAWSYVNYVCYLKTYKGTYKNPGTVARVKKAKPPPADVCSQYGEELSDTDISGDMVATVAGIQNDDFCCAECDKHAGCEAWSYVQQTCYLKKFQ